MNACPCGSAIDLTECCGPLHDGTRDAATAEALMRARYSAFATGRVEYIMNTVHPEKQDEHEPESTRAWATESEWLGLEIIDTQAGQADDDEGIVEFVAQYRTADGELIRHHEIASFARVEGTWFFHDGQPAPQATVRRQEPKVGRNDACPCGSGRKYKKCCAA